ncbi:hypothetical protein IGI04_030151 [Brassica rapa subsp. trilocularis]|uniref:RING-type E3 ubiquitin transferase n=1 Tax=Brassica rapa subsp. trilocularis TaxID=1813537 RepID=A0ABQ7LRF6_BRACM|nr:hypothetical protein IGI04_030151 [Brassica rapa subsp. trilocularis]
MPIEEEEEDDVREPSMLVRESAAEQLEERQSDWAYLKPVVVLDFVWNLAFVAEPNTPLRVWIIGYGLQCVMHMEGASKEDIDQLTKFKFRKVGESEKHNVAQIHPSNILLWALECCICLSAYEDETELRELPCGHHFHCSCVDKWLYINDTSPLCKYNILKDSNYDEYGEEV